MKAILAFLVLVALGIAGYLYSEANHDFTPWMTGAELDKFCADHEGQPPNNHPNFWDNGHWVDAVEGRWHEGIPQYRLRYSAYAKGNGLHHAWYWYFNQDQQSFSSHVHQLADQGYTLLDPNSFSRPDDTRRYQGVWHRVQTDAEVAAEKAAHPSDASTSFGPAVPIVEQGTQFSFSTLDRAQLGHRCSVYLKPGEPAQNPRTDLPPGMYTVRNGIVVVTGNVYSIAERMILIMNQRRIYPVLDEQVDYIIVAP